jgi:hypothetical protein
MLTGDVVVSLAENWRCSLNLLGSTLVVLFEKRSLNPCEFLERLVGAFYGGSNRTNMQMLAQNTAQSLWIHTLQLVFAGVITALVNMGVFFASQFRMLIVVTYAKVRFR